jgi:hypothetical protein
MDELALPDFTDPSLSSPYDALVTRVFAHPELVCP